MSIREVRIEKGIKIFFIQTQDKDDELLKFIRNIIEQILDKDDKMYNPVNGSYNPALCKWEFVSIANLYEKFYIILFKC